MEFDTGGALTASISEFEGVPGLGHNPIHTLAKTGETDPVVAGGYRLVVLPSYRTFNC